MNHARFGALVLVLWHGSASANSGQFVGSGSDLIPLRDSNVQMHSEDIVAVETRDGSRWRVRARYEFINRSEQPVRLQVGFPEKRCAPRPMCEQLGNGTPWTFDRLRTTVDGKLVQHRIGRVSPKAHPWAESIDRVHLFNVEFPPGKKVKIVHSYTMGQSFNNEIGTLFYYMTRTGTLWRGKIERARFTVRVAKPPEFITYPKEYKLASYSERFFSSADEKAQQMTELVWEMNDWAPEHDFNLMLGIDEPQYVAECPYHHLGDKTMAEAVEAPLSTAKARFGKLTNRQLVVCHKMVLARHGYPFRNPKRRAFFYRPPTHTRDPLKVTVGHDEYAFDHLYTRFDYLPNPHWSPRLLSKEDRVYMSLVRLLYDDRKGQGQ